jgi:hypothetical protein
MVRIESKMGHRDLDIHLVDLGQDGVAFMRSELDQNCPLSTVVAKLFDNNDKVFALMPEGTGLDRAKQFKRGGLMGMGETHKWFADYIAKTFSNNGDSIQIIFEDPWMKPCDFTKIPQKQPFFFSRSTIYYAPDSSNLFSTLNAGMKEVKSSTLIGFIVSPPVSVPQKGAAIRKETLMQLAKNTRAVFVSAYDQESYVVWQKDA